ncbi:MAG: MotA/TolQ/ExbB proton channel family protein [bacterium]
MKDFRLKLSGPTLGMLIIYLMVNSFDIVYGQKDYNIAISNISIKKIHKNWLFVPTSADLRVEWSVSTAQVINRKEKSILEDAKTLPFVYQVYLFEGNLNNEPEIKEVRNAAFADFDNKDVGTKYFFKVYILTPDSKLVAESEPASILVGRGNNGTPEGTNAAYYLHPGRWQLLAAGKPEIYDKSTTLGQMAFIFLSLTAVLSFIVLLYYSTRSLYLGNIFPFKRSLTKFFWSLSLSCDLSYERRLTNKFKFVLNAWEMIAKKSREVADKAAKNVPNGLSSTEKLASIDVACMEYWTSDGDKAIGTIEEIIAFPRANQINGQKKPDDLLTELVIKIEDSFNELISRDGNGGFENTDKVDMENLIDEIYEPVVVDNKVTSRVRKWFLRKGVFEMKKGLEPFPTSKIIRAGLEIHRNNGYRWLKPSEEVKHAFENRASNEIENLRRKSKIDWFWNYGALAPLVGLFGTVTGITNAFQELSRSHITPNFVNMIQQLSSGIFEALWTTIFGLANGIIFVLLYYYYKHKLDWIYSKWEEIYISISEKL